MMRCRKADMDDKSRLLAEAVLSIADSLTARQ
jgi:hypothetical protein